MKTARIAGLEQTIPTGIVLEKHMRDLYDELRGREAGQNRMEDWLGSEEGLCVRDWSRPVVASKLLRDFRRSAGEELASFIKDKFSSDPNIIGQSASLYCAASGMMSKPRGAACLFLSTPLSMAVSHVRCCGERGDGSCGILP